MRPIQIISQDLFDKVRSRFSNLEMGTEDGGVTIDPSDARFFDFDFVVEENNLGRVSISINDPGSLKIYYSQGITEGQESEIKRYWYDFLKEMRYFAMRRLLRFDTRDISKSNLDKNDFQYLASTKPKDETAMNMNESRWTGRNSSKTSRRVQGRTEVIVRHKDRVNEMLPADRSKPGNITAIFIQNADGERFKAPFNYLPLAFALAQHIDHGGVPYDAPAKKIIGMCEQIAQLSEFRKHIKSSKLHGDTLGIVDRAVGRLNELKTQLESLGKKRHYESWLAEFNETESLEDELIELSPVQMEEYKSKFTQTEFNENLAKYFPLIHSIMQEKINLEDYVKKEEQNIEEQTKETVSEFDEFVEWSDKVVENKLDLNKLQDNLQGEQLSKVLSEIPLGPGGSTAWAKLSTLFDLDERDEDDEALKNQLEAKAETADQEATGVDSPAMSVFKGWIEDSSPQWKEDLPELFPQEQPQLTPGPETGMQPAPAPQPGISQQATPSPETGMQPAPQPVAEDKSNNLMQKIAETVKQFYNASNESVGPFRSEEAVCLEVEKTISEEYGEAAGKRAGMIAKKFMEKLTRQWEMKHHKDKEELKPVEDDGLSRLKELLGTVKDKMESFNQDKPEQDKPKFTTPKPEQDKPKFTTPKPEKQNPYAQEGALDKVKQFGKKVLDKVAPDDETLLKKLQKDVGVPQTGKPPEKKTGDVASPKADLPEMADILKLSGLKKY